MNPLLFRFNTAPSDEKVNARNFLVIPKDRRVYLILASEMNFKMLTSVCNELLQTQTGDFIIYVFVERSSELQERLKAYYSQIPRVQAVIFNKHLKTFLDAADVVLSKLGAVTRLSLSVEEAYTN